MIHGHKWRMCRGEAERKQKTQSQGTAFYHRNGIQGKQKADLTNGRLYENNLEKILLSHDIPLSLQ
ncbi:hypothetical protein HR13_02530 [Porphyromonas gulae]|nr:hypothetical protein HR13_02530 [Porphyromonas gulae]